MKALIYCRVSTTRQVTEGHGLESQELRCRQYANSKGYGVERVFLDDGVSGGLFERPAMKKLITFLDQNQKEKFVIIFDDLKRFARNTEVHLRMRAELSSRGAKLECLNFNFDESPEGHFAETVMASAAQLEREQNKRQVVQKMMARLESGYFPFCAPPAYENTRDEKHGKIVVPKHPEAEYLKEALEGFATGKLFSQKDVQVFLEKKGFSSKWQRKGIHLEAVKRLLTNKFYSGWVECKKWKICVRGRHEALISDETFERIQERLFGKVRTHVRNDIRDDFPLRGSVLCACCGEKLTASWSTGRTKTKFPYYRCKTPKCLGSIPKKKMEDEFEEKLSQMKPHKKLLELFGAILGDVHAQRGEMGQQSERNAQKELGKIEVEIEKLLDASLNAKSQKIRELYEEKLEKVQKEKEELEDTSKNSTHFVSLSAAFERGKHTLQNPLETWKKGSTKAKMAVQNLVFRNHLLYDRKNAFGNSEMSLLFSILQPFEGGKSHLVEMGGIEPPSKKAHQCRLPSHSVFRDSFLR
jgi:site-specific DNA recombinase